MNRDSSDFTLHPNQKSSEANPRSEDGSNADADDSRAIQHQKILEQLNQTPKFTDEWFQLKDEEIKLRSSLACNESSSNSSRSSEADKAHNYSSDKSKASSSTDVAAGNKGHDPPLRNTNAAYNEHVSDSPIESRGGLATNKPEVTGLIEMLDSNDDEGPLVPLSAGFAVSDVDRNIELLDAPDDDAPPIPFSFGFKDAGKGNQKGAQDFESKQPAYPIVVLNQYEESPSQQTEGRSRAMHTSCTSGNELHSSPPLIVRETNSTSVIVATELLSQTSQAEHVPNEEKSDDMIMIPEAFLVEEEVPVEIPFAEVAEFAQPEQDRGSIVSMNKHHFCILLTVCVAGIAVALGVSLSDKLSKGNEVNASSVETTPPRKSSPAPSLQPSFAQPSLQPSFAQPSMQPSQSIRYEIEKNVLQRNASFDDMNPSDYRMKALDWIVQQDQMNLNVRDLNLHQRYILALLAYGVSPLEDSWLLDTEECQWPGVNCDGDRNVIDLGLSSARLGLLKGTIPPEIVGLRSLQVFDLGGNALYGSFPMELGQIPSLTHLWLWQNQLAGTLPSEIGQLTSLIEIRLDANKFTGTFPSEIGLLTSLNKLEVFGNAFLGTLPSELGHLKSLTMLRVDDNDFSGTLPSELGQLKNLSFFWLGNNQFTGTFPSELGQLTELTDLNFDSNNFTGTLPF